MLQEEDAKVKRAFQTLLTYVGNVARSPDEEKFRKIRLTNATFQVLHFIPSFLSSRLLCSFNAGAEDWKACISLTSAGKGWEPERRSWISSALRIPEGRGWFSCYTSGESGSNVAQYCRLWAQLCHSQSFLWSVVERLQLRPLARVMDFFITGGPCRTSSFPLHCNKQALFTQDLPIYWLPFPTS